MTRIIPYAIKSNYAAPNQCFVDSPDPDPTICKACTSSFNPVYDPRCRSWYTAVSSPGSDPHAIYFEDPRASSFGTLVITASRQYELNGVLIFNVLAARLTDAINELVIFQTGYAFFDQP